MPQPAQPCASHFRGRADKFGVYAKTDGPPKTSLCGTPRSFERESSGNGTPGDESPGNGARGDGARGDGAAARGF